MAGSPGRAAPPPAALPARTRLRAAQPRLEGRVRAGEGAALAPILDRGAAGETLGGGRDRRGCSRRAAPISTRSARPPTRCAGAVNGDRVTYVVNRNINYTNVCYFRCQFCAFSKGKLSDNLRGRPYDLTLDEIERRAVEAWERGATEVCLQGGIHPDYTGATYLAICRAIKEAVPDIHIHAFSPLEVTQGAHDARPAGGGVSCASCKAAGLGTLPGTAAEILDDEVRAVICPDKIKTDEWLDVMETAHAVGLRTTATIMYGHVEGLEHWARHLLRLRATAGAHRRLHRIRAAAVRAHGDADLSAGPRPPRRRPTARRC